MSVKKDFKVTKQNEGVFFVDKYVKGAQTSQEFWCLLRSDAHHDNPHSDNRMEKRHLDEAIERNAFIIDNGDAFCAMQGKGDPRASKNDIKKEHTKGSYLDSLVSTYADFLEPYAQNIAIMGKGNHELSVYKHRETDLTERLVSLLNGRTGSHIKSGQIANWIGFRVRHGGKNGRSKVLAKTLWLYLFHGSGGGGPVTKGVIGANRMGVVLPDANLVATGHTHDHWFLPNARARITTDGTEYIDEQLHIKIPTYKNEYGVHDSGFHMEKGRPPKPLGAVWLKFSLQVPKELSSFHLKCEASRAE